MRDVVSCFSEHAVNVSHPSCSNHSNTACITPTLTPSVQNAVTCLYRLILSSQKQLLVTVNWCKNNTAQGLSINFGDDPSLSFKLNMNSRLFRKKKGSRILESELGKVEIFWDLSNAKYDSGPEPVDGFYVLVMVDSEIGLILGNMAEEAVTKKFKTSTPAAKVSLIARQEHCSGNTLYSTKAQFCDKGIVHEILIRCSGEKEGLKHPVLSVCIDKKMVIRVKRLQWNFRGNQTIFVDGLLVDLLWDVHDWFFNPASGYAVFMFRTRSGMDSRLWLEEKMVQQKEPDRVEFSLLIYACKSS
ncbi:hypothetical protein FEM48_Zijuj02G0027100 [Ziziphus jujuba var. spinosa]|uniref:Uncharacterized protein n=1 Tax=Ziziphus jujuba var. spinosa TaxID=714518 RepID=A0A978VT54_ZIZJJ|nr:hypothetical protein FEM48_Zijuj02G0027100 [Ziziphus jujuba var. spinosa]